MSNQIPKEQPAEQPEATNQISEHTGQFDARFMLWRMFCTENSVPVESLPSDLTGETKEKWEKMKNDQLHNEGS